MQRKNQNGKRIIAFIFRHRGTHLVYAKFTTLKDIVPHGMYKVNNSVAHRFYKMNRAILVIFMSLHIFSNQLLLIKYGSDYRFS